MQADARRQFRIGRCLGRGGFGEVYRATMRSHGGLETAVALKILRSDLEIGADALTRLRDEGRLLARIRHPAVVRVYDLVRLEGRIALITEIVDGDDLDACLRRPGRIGIRALVQAIGPVAAALEAASTTPGPDGSPLRIVHRDIKPTNVRIGRHGEVKLLDFGIARFQAVDRESKTVSDVVVGSVPYMAPERFVERASLPAGDVFGLGCCLFEGAAGRPFHQDGGLRAVSTLSLDPGRYQAHLEASLAELDTPEPLSRLISDCLQFDPGSRPQPQQLAVRCESLADRLAGITLRRWCADRAFGALASSGGELEGLTLLEGDLAAAPLPPPPRIEPGPRLVQRPLGTIDPDGLAAPPPLAAPPLHPPHALPSLPVGVVLVEGPQRIVDTDSASRPRRTEPPISQGSGTGSAAALAVGCAAAAMIGSAALVAGGLVGVWLGLR